MNCREPCHKKRLVSVGFIGAVKEKVSFVGHVETGRGREQNWTRGPQSDRLHVNTRRQKLTAERIVLVITTNKTKIIPYISSDVIVTADVIIPLRTHLFYHSLTNQ